MPINELGSFDRARKPDTPPGPQRVIAHPVVPEPDTSLSPENKKFLADVLGDSHSGGWVNDKSRF